jgi:hypothetical protein
VPVKIKDPSTVVVSVHKVVVTDDTSTSVEVRRASKVERVQLIAHVTAFSKEAKIGESRTRRCHREFWQPATDRAYQSVVTTENPRLRVADSEPVKFKRITPHHAALIPSSKQSLTYSPMTSMWIDTRTDGE